MIAPVYESTADLILAEEEHLRRVARKLTHCDADADDLVQDTMLRAWRARSRFEPGTSVRAWTTTILRRVFLTDVVRARRRGVETDTDAGAPIEHVSAPSAPAVPDRIPDVASIGERLEDPVKRALGRVPPIYLEPFVLSVIQDLSCAEIAERLHVPEGTVMSRIHRARERLKRDLVYEGQPCTRPNSRIGRFVAA